MRAPSHVVLLDDAAGPRSSSAGRALALVGAMFACEVGATLLFVLARQPLLALLVIAVGVGIALRWVRAHRRRAAVAIASQIAAAREALAGGNRTAAWNLACGAAQAAADRRRRNAALAVMIDVAVEERDLRTARSLVGRMGSERDVDPLAECAIELADGGPEAGIRALERGRRRPTFGAAAARRLIELLAERDELSRAVEVALAYFDLLSKQDLRNMVASLEGWGATGHAVTVALALALRTRTRHAPDELTHAPDPLHG